MTFIVEFNHGGYFVYLPMRSYQEGKVDLYKDVDPDLMSMIEVKDMVERLGYEGVRKMEVYHLLPDDMLDNGLREIVSDRDLMDMFACHEGRSTIKMYFVIDRVSNGLVAKTVTHEDVTKLKKLHSLGTDGDFNDLYKSSVLYNTLEDENTEYENLEQFDEDDDLLNDDVVDGLFGIAKENVEAEIFGATNGVGSKIGHASISLSDEENDSIYTPPNSDDEKDAFERYQEFNEETDMKKPQLCVNMLFASATVFRKALREFVIQQGFDFRFVKNESDRITAVCKEECGWRIHASYAKNDKRTFQIKTFQHVHTCSRSYNNRQATSAWLARTYLQKLRDDPDWKIFAIQRSVKREHNIDVSRSQVYRAKRRAIEVIQGSYKEQYERVWDYGEMVVRTNPNSIIRVCVDRPLPNMPRVFQRMFICLEAVKVGFIVGCRPMIGLDGCHLKGPFGGQMLHAVGKDGNENLFPIAYAVVEAETRDSWTWFLNELCEAIGSPEEKGWTFISDRQKGLVETFNYLIPSADHRFCLRHMYANFKEHGYKGKALKDLMWAAASSYTVPEFEKHMANIRELNEQAYWYLRGVEPTLWARSVFRTYPKSDMLCNNFSESFNKWIMEARDKPILTMLEMIRRQLMKRLQEKRQKMMETSGLLCPAIQKKLDVIKDKARHCQSLWAGAGEFEVECFGKKFVVDLQKKTCQCRKWDLTGIPCHHAVSAIFFHKGKPEDYVDSYYHRETYIKAYTLIIHPIPDMSQWVHLNLEHVNPPPLRRPPGRPKKLRRKAADEVQNPDSIRKRSTSLRCGNCNQFGHNSRTCKGPVNPKKRVYKWKLKNKGNAAGISKSANEVGDTSGGTSVQVNVGMQGVQMNTGVESVQVTARKEKAKGKSVTARSNAIRTNYDNVSSSHPIGATSSSQLVGGSANVLVGVTGSSSQPLGSVSTNLQGRSKVGRVSISGSGLPPPSTSALGLRGLTIIKNLAKESGNHGASFGSSSIKTGSGGKSPASGGHGNNAQGYSVVEQSINLVKSAAEINSAKAKHTGQGLGTTAKIKPNAKEVGAKVKPATKGTIQGISLLNGAGSST